MSARQNLEDRKARHTLQAVAAYAAKADSLGVTLRSVKQDLAGERFTEEGKAIDIRCACGSLLAKMTRLGIEIKCRKCKRILMIPYSQFSDETGATHKNVKD
jgi:phage FluMu protein Com